MTEILIIFLHSVPCAEHCKGDRKNFQLMYQKLDARHFLKNMVSKGQDNLVKYEFLS